VPSSPDAAAATATTTTTAATTPADESQAADQEQLSIVGGVGALKALLIVGFVLAFVAVYGYFIEKIWTASSGRPPSFDAAIIATAGALSGILGSGFALALGVARPDDSQAPRFVPARVADKFKGISITLTLGIWAYAIVGGAACVTTLLNTGETPEVVKGLAAVFGGYILTLASGAFRSIRSSG
jgi:hypothetical protein